jgi:protein LTV1
LISGKTGMPKDIFGKGLTANALKQLDFSNGGDNYRNEETATLASRVSAISIRPPHETTDEKRDRKAAVKELRKERRVEKKVNKTAFREEQNRQIKHAANQGNSIGKRVT